MANVRIDHLQTPAAGLVQGAAPRRTYPQARIALAVLLVCAAYYAAGVVALALRMQPGGISGIWLPHGVLLAALVLTPVRSWWLYLVALFPVHLHLVREFQGAVPLVVMVMQFGGNVLQAVGGAIAVRYFIGPAPRLDTLRNMTVFLVLGVVLPVLAVSALVAALFLLAGWVNDFWLAWHRRTLAGVLGAVVLTPAIVQVCVREAAATGAVPRQRQLEFAALTIGVLALALPALGGGGSFASSQALLFAPLPLLLWMAVRFGPRGLSPPLLVIALAALAVTKLGEGPFAAASPAESVLSVQTFLLSVSVPLLLLSALVAERKQAEAALRASEERYREVVDSQTELVCRYLPDTTLTFVNEAYCRFFGLTRNELIGRRFVELLPDSARAATLSQVASLVQKPRVCASEGEMIRVDGTVTWQQWVDYAVVASDGRVVEVQRIGRDITDRKRFEEANENLAHASRLAVMGELTASIAHEINQPLGAILSNADAAEILLDARPVPIDDLRSILDDIRKDDIRASEVIRHMRALMRKRELTFQPFDLNRAVGDVLHLAGADLAKRRVAVTTEFAQLPIARGDPVHVQQVVLNLILNGVDAMAELPPSRRQLDIRTARSKDGEIEVSVTDAGPGIPPEQALRLFESFYTTKKEGMGLGLSIARSIVEAHGGRIWAESGAGGAGAKFVFSIPARPKRAAAETRTSARSA